MTDTQSAGLLVIIGGIGFALWYRSRSEAERSALVGGEAAAPPAAGSAQTANAQFGPSPTAPSAVGGTGGRILSQAEKALGESTYQINPRYPTKACATFVSDILAQVGLIKGCYPSVRGLEPALKEAGGEQVAYGAALSEQGALQPGDVILFANQKGLGHTAIYAGGGEVIGTSSENKAVTEQPLTAFRKTYRTYEAFRFK